jgi:hypothetical protein
LDHVVHGLERHRRSHADAPPDQRLDILKFNPKDRNLIGRGHTASVTASGLRRNQSRAAASTGASTTDANPRLNQTTSHSQTFQNP